MTIREANAIFKEHNGENAGKYVFAGYRDSKGTGLQYKERCYCEADDWGYVDYCYNCYNMWELFEREGLDPYIYLA